MTTYRPSPEEYVYRCPHCRSRVAFGDGHCRGCGHAFDAADFETMNAGARLRGPDIFWKVNHAYRCPRCRALAYRRDRFCAGCGAAFDREAWKRMKSERPDRNLVPMLAAVLLVLAALAWLA